MVVAVWSAKAGVGVSSFAALLALSQAQHARETLLVDLCGDVPALLAVEDQAGGPGVADWCALDDPVASDLRRLEVPVATDLALLPVGAGPVGSNAVALIEALSLSNRTVVVDCGFVEDPATLRGRVVTAASASLLVMRRCYLNLRAAQHTDLRASGVVMLSESGRSLGRSDIEAVTQVPVVADIAIDESIARAIDAGLIRSRVPRSLLRQLDRVVADAA